MAWLFQFPSNGKVYPKATLEEIHCFYLNGFQFPSNGKVYPKSQDEGFSYPYSTLYVSIPFKRESVSKVLFYRLRIKGKEVSIPFKRESVSKG